MKKLQSLKLWVLYEFREFFDPKAIKIATVIAVIVTAIVIVL